MSRVLPQKPISLQPVKKFPTFYGTQWFITASTRARHLPISWATSTQSIPAHHTSWKQIFILSFHPCLGLPSGFFPTYFPTKIMFTLLLSPIRATWASHLILPDLIIWMIFGEEYRLLSSSLCSFLHSPATLPSLDPNIFLSTLFSNTLSLCSSLNVRDQDSHPYKNNRQKLQFCISWYLYFWTANWETKTNLHRMIASIPWLQFALHFFTNDNLVCSIIASLNWVHAFPMKSAVTSLVL